MIKEDFVRWENEELVNLVMFFLQKPGALHKARWMSKRLYSIKMDLLNQIIVDELPKGAVFESGQ